MIDNLWVRVYNEYILAGQLIGKYDFGGAANENEDRVLQSALYAQYPN